jgi:hypothetical protein
MEGWRQGRLGSKEDHSTTNCKTDLTLTGLLMEGLGNHSLKRISEISDGLRNIVSLANLIGFLTPFGPYKVLRANVLSGYPFRAIGSALATVSL